MSQAKNIRTYILVVFMQLGCYIHAQDYYEAGKAEYFKDHDSIALRLFDLAITNNQRLPEAYMMKGAAEASLGLYQDARTDLSTAIELDTNNAKAYFYFGRVFFLQKFYFSAQKYYNMSLQKNNKDPDVYDDRAMCRFFNGDLQGAIGDEDAAISLDPKNEEYFNTRGFCKLKLELYGEAIKDFDRSLKIKPTPMAYGNKGVVLFGLQNYEAAITCLSSSLRLASDDPQVLYYRGMCFLRTGKMTLACEDLTKSASLNWEPAKAEALKCPQR